MRLGLFAALVLILACCVTRRAWAQAPERAASAIVTQPQWRIADDGQFVDAEGGVFHLRFAYGGKGSAGWFKGGGGQDLSIVELYYKPSSATRLVLRDGA